MPRGGKRPGAGRPATGQTTAVLIVRFPIDIVATIKRRALNEGRPVSEYLLPLMEHEFRPRASRTGKRDRRKQPG